MKAKEKELVQFFARRPFISDEALATRGVGSEGQGGVSVLQHAAHITNEAISHSGKDIARTIGREELPKEF